jgi:hypothetical protein
MRVCFRTSDDRILESQSGNDETGLAVLAQNALNAGLAEADFRLAIVPDDDFAALLNAQLAADRAKTPPPMDGVTFMGRFTDAELQAIYAAAASSIQLTRWIEMLRLRGEIELAGSTALAAKAALVAAGLLSQDRADAVFAPTS